MNKIIIAIFKIRRNDYLSNIKSNWVNNSQQWWLFKVISLISEEMTVVQTAV